MHNFTHLKRTSLIKEWTNQVIKKLDRKKNASVGTHCKRSSYIGHWIGLEIPRPITIPGHPHVPSKYAPQMTTSSTVSYSSMYKSQKLHRSSFMITAPTSVCCSVLSSRSQLRPCPRGGRSFTRKQKWANPFSIAKGHLLFAVNLGEKYSSSECIRLASQAETRLRHEQYCSV